MTNDESKILSAILKLSQLTLLPTPMPPDTISAPVLVVVDSVVLDIKILLVVVEPLLVTVCNVLVLSNLKNVELVVPVLVTVISFPPKILAPSVAVVITG